LAAEVRKTFRLDREEEMRRHKHEKRQKFFFSFFSMPLLISPTLPFFSGFINENCWRKMKQQKGSEREDVAREREKEEMGKKPTDNKQHNSDLKGDFQASLRGEMQKKRAKSMFFE
jgi:hypothetical protein